MLGIIDVGGGYRDIFGTAILDYCMENNIHFDYCLGVSAGSANLAAYVSGQRKRNILFYTEYPKRKEYMSVHNFIKTRSILDLDYIYGTLSNESGESPFDFDSFFSSPIPYACVASNALTGEATYFDKSCFARNDLRPIMASCCVPAANRPYVIDGVPYYDGGICDPIPIKKALADGCDRIVLILTRPRDQIRNSEKDSRQAALFIHHKYPLMAEALKSRAKTYNDGVAYAKELEKQGKCLILAPTDIQGLKTLTIDYDKQMDLYRQGCEAALSLPKWLEETSH